MHKFSFSIRTLCLAVCWALIALATAPVSAVMAADFTWNAAADGSNWTSTSNWSVSGADADGIPDGDDNVFFSGTSVKTSIVDQPITINSLSIVPAYTGKVTLQSNLTIGSSLTGAGNSAIDGSSSLILSGVPAGSAAGSFTANFTGPIKRLHISATGGIPGFNVVTPLNVGDLTLTNLEYHVGQPINVSGNLTSAASMYRSTGVIAFVGGGTHTLAGTGYLQNLEVQANNTAVLANDFSLRAKLQGAGNIQGATNTERLIMSGIAVGGSVGGFTADFTGTIERLQISATGGIPSFNVVTPLNVKDLTLTNLEFHAGQPINVSGNLTSTAPMYRSTGVIALVGGGNHTLAGTGYLQNLDVQANNTAVLANDFLLLAKLQGAGNIQGATNTERLIIVGFASGGGVGSFTADFTGTVKDLQINAPGGIPGFGVLKPLNVGNLILTGLSKHLGQPINVSGDVVSTAPFDSVGTGFIKFTGGGTHRLSGTGFLYNLEVEAGNTVALANDFKLRAALNGGGTIQGQTGGEKLLFIGVPVGSGAGSFTADFNGTIQNLQIDATGGIPGFGVVKPLNVGNLTLTGLLRHVGQSINVSGDIVSTTAFNGGAFIKFVGIADQNVSGSGRLYNIDFAKPSGTVKFLPGFTTTFNSVLVSLGQWLLLDNDAITAPFTVSGGTLGGTGQINGAVTVNSGGKLTAGHSPGILTINGNLALNSGATFYVEINGDTPGTQHDQVAVNGAVAINGASLAGATGGTPTSNIILIANDGTDAIGGTRFAGAATNGTAVLIGGQTYSINYNGGTGNDLAFTALAPEIDVKGNSVSIVSGDSTPSASDHSDFGSVNVSSGTVVRTFTIQNTGAAALSVSTPTLSGANAGDFSITSATAASVAANGSTTFQVTFDPSAPGVRTATINIGNNDSNENPYTFAIQGTGDQPSTDADSDGVADASDNCPAAANADQLNSDNDAQGNACDTDDDNDGVLDVNDAFPLNAAEAVDTDGDGTGNNADTDDDNDGVADVNDAFPLNAAESVDTDGDGIGNNADTDDDGDSVLDGNDVFPLNPNESADTDHDGIGNNADTDDDGDSVADVNDAFPLNDAESLDTDGDGIGNNADTDDDNDGVNDDNDAFPLNASESLDTDGDGIGNNADTDDDNDGVADANDAFSLDPNESLDTDGDGIGNNADTDDDNDSILDVNDAFPLNPNETADNDSDGIGNNTDPDDDNDGVADVNDAFPLNASEAIDSDHDGVGDNGDPDDDNDGVNDDNDAFPLNASESLDTDGDTIGNNTDTDDDGDGVLDVNDAFPLNPNESLDSDGDGIGNNADPDNDNDGVNDSVDAFPLDPTESLDTDHDGIGNNADPDDDNDDVADANDAFPLNPAESLDTDHDGTGNNADPDDDDDNVADANDAFPLDATESVDTDGDGIGNNADPDDDDDSVLDANDAFPLDAAESVDTDGDGIGNNADPDDDDDSVLDANDAFPLNAAESLDTDGDGIGNNADPDDDNDGIADATDAFPLNPNETVDNDGDGIGNNADPDDDNDGVADATDAFPLNASESVDSDHDGIGNNGDPDDDNDGVNDSVDAFPLNPAESVDTDHDGVGNNADSDDDGDGVTDANDAFPLDANESADTDHDGIGNNADPDDDNDGVNDNVDAFPLNSAESLDTDGDGIGNNADADDDNDGVPDAQDPFPTTRDTIPPVITLAAGPITLWPPDHQYVTIPIANFVLNATDATDSQVSRNSVTITKVTSDEVEDAADDGDGNTLKDMVIATDGKAVALRAERQGGGNGRVYTIHVQVSDRGGNTTTMTFKVQVPKSQGKNQAVDDGPVYTVTRPVSSVAAASVDRGSLTGEADAVDKASQSNRFFLPVVKR